MTNKAEVEALCERLEDEAMRLSGVSLDRGSVDAGIASNLAFEAAAMLRALVEETERKGAEIICALHGVGMRDLAIEAAEARAIAAERKAEAMRDNEAVERGARALFCHHEGHPVGKETLDYWFGCDEQSFGEDLDCKRLCDDLRAEARVVLDAALSAHKGDG